MALTIASLMVVLICSLITPCTCFTWTAGPPPNGNLQECLGNNVSLDWDFLTSTEDSVFSVQWIFTNETHADPQYVATASSRTFVLLSNNKTRVEFLPKAGLRLYNVSTQDLGTYTVNINLFHGRNVINKQRSVTLALPDTPVLSSGRVKAWVVSGTVTLRGSSHMRLACGTINNHQHANFSVTWTTPSGRSLPSTSQADGVFYLTLDNPVAGGPYSCQLQGITALSCLRKGSQTTMAVVDVDALGARMLVLEDSARRHDRDLELQERVADVVSQSINNITVNLQVVDELNEETSERVENLCTHVQVIDNVTTQTVQRVDNLSKHVQVIDNVTTQTAQRMDNLSTHVQVIDNVTTQTAQRVDKVTRNVEDQGEAQSRMKESLNGVMEELTNQSGRVTNLALSVDDLKSDTEKLSGSVDSLSTDTKTLSGSVDSLTSDTKTLSGSVDSLTSELRATVDVQRKQIEAMTSEGEKQHADMVLLFQKTNNLTALAERQQEELIQQKQTISELSTLIDTQSGNMAQQRETITSLMSNLTFVVDILGTMPNFTLYRALVGPVDCAEVRRYDRSSGVHTVYPYGTAVKVYCDQDTDSGGWTVIQRRQDGSVDFYRGWSEYERGFGDVSREFWLGLEKIHQLTSSGNYSLRIDLWDVNGTHIYAQYNTFYIDGASDKYTLHIAGYSGTAGDSMLNAGIYGKANNMAFSTHDRDNDLATSNCASSHKAGWWYDSCQHSNLNGQYHVDGRPDVYGVRWRHYRHDDRSFVRVEIKMRPRS